MHITAKVQRFTQRTRRTSSGPQRGLTPGIWRGNRKYLPGRTVLCTSRPIEPETVEE